VHCQAGALQLLEPSVETRLDALSFLHSPECTESGFNAAGRLRRA
jgi:hypothetical protein